MIHLGGVGKAWLAAAIACVCCLGLAGCVTNDATTEIRSFLAQDQSPDDSLPAGIEIEGLDTGSSRLVGSNDGVTYYLAKFVIPESGAPGVCIVLVKSSNGVSSSSCGSPVGLRAYGSETGGAKVVQSSDDVPAGWVRLSDFLIVISNVTAQKP